MSPRLQAGATWSPAGTANGRAGRKGVRVGRRVGEAGTRSANELQFKGILVAVADNGAALRTAHAESKWVPDDHLNF